MIETLFVPLPVLPEDSEYTYHQYVTATWIGVAKQAGHDVAEGGHGRRPADMNLYPDAYGVVRIKRGSGIHEYTLVPNEDGTKVHATASDDPWETP